MDTHTDQVQQQQQQHQSPINPNTLNGDLFGYIDRSLQKFMEAGYYQKSQEQLNRNDYFGSRNDLATNYIGRSNFDMDQVNYKLNYSIFHVT